MAWLKMKNMRNCLKRKNISRNFDVGFHKNIIIRKDIKKVYNVICRASVVVTDREEYGELFGMEEDIKENINVMVYQEESIDVDVDRKSNQSFNIDASKSSFGKLLIWIGRTLFRQAQRLVLNVGIGQMKVRNLRKHMVKTHMNLGYNSGSHMTRLCQMDGRVDRKSWR